MIKLHLFMTDANLAGPQFAEESWSTWKIIARLLDGDAHLLTEEQKAIARTIIGRDQLPSDPPKEFIAAVRRRVGKTTFCGCLIACTLATDYRSWLRRGEQAIVAGIAPTLDQAHILTDRARGIIEGIPMLAAKITRSTALTIEFEHGTKLEVAAASFRSIRGRTFALAVLDECAFLRSDESALPDLELARALRPGLLTLGGRLVAVSSPHMRKGLLWDAYSKYFGAVSPS